MIEVNVLNLRAMGRFEQESLSYQDAYLYLRRTKSFRHGNKQNDKQFSHFSITI